MSVLSVVSFVFGVLCLGYLAVVISYAGPATSAAWVWAAGGLFFLFVAFAAKRSAADGQVQYRGLWVTGGALFAALALAFCMVGNQIALGMKAVPGEDLEYVIVLGAQVKKDRPSKALRKRLDTAYAYAVSHPEAQLVLSGGQGRGEDISEAQCMYEYLREKGLEDARLLLEDRSATTRENLRFSDERYGLKEKRVGVLSNNFHVYRAMMLAKKEGYTDVSGIPAPIEPVMLPHYFVREVIAVVYYSL